MKILPFEKSCASNPELVKIWHIENELNPEQVSLKSKIKIKWNCFTCNHIYEQTPNKKFSGRNCPYCSIPSKFLCNNDNCKICFNKSCASNNEYIKIWSDERHPRQVFLTSSIKIKWKCDKCNHIYHQTLGHKKRGDNCPYCSNHILCNDMECKKCFEKSCASNKNLMEKWAKNVINPRNIFLNSSIMINWKCNLCKHIHNQSPNNKFGKNSGCPYCSNSKLCNDNDCEECFNKSCASIKEFCEIWGKNNLTPRDVFIKSGLIINWDCKNCNKQYKQKIIEKFYGSGCPTCKNKTEKLVVDFLENKNINFKHQFKLLNDTKRYDILCVDYKTIIEIDGRQHFENVHLFKSTAKENQENDKNKMMKAMKEEYSFIRICQEDIWYNKIDWKNIILDNLKIRNKPIVLYFSSIETLYDNHQLEC